MQEISVRSLGWEDPLEKEMAAHSSILAWEMPWTAEPGRLPSMGSQRVGHYWARPPPKIHLLCGETGFRWVWALTEQEYPTSLPLLSPLQWFPLVSLSGATFTSMCPCSCLEKWKSLNAMVSAYDVADLSLKRNVQAEPDGLIIWGVWWALSHKKCCLPTK